MILKMSITNEFIIQYLQKTFKETGKVPARNDFRNSQEKNLPFSCRIIDTRFGKWNNALKLAGLIPNQVREESKDVVCDQCGITFTKQYSKIKHTKHNFCSQRCSGTYYNQNRKYGGRTSKFERYIQKCVKQFYPGFEWEFNYRYNKCELDIYLPQFDLAIEINGIVHYKPIYGQEKFEKMQVRDKHKLLVCEQNQIQLYVVDISQVKQFSEIKAEPFLQFIREKIDERVFSYCLPINVV